MANPLVVAARGKGIFPMLSRAGTIAGRYGLTVAKMDHALAQIAQVLQEFDCHATIPVTANAISRHQAIAQKYNAQGLELAVHGYMHVDYRQLSLDQQRDHLHQACQVFTQAGIPFAGFRCPYLRWNADTLDVLRECGFAYESSQALAWDAIGSLVNDAYTRALQFYGAQDAAQHASLPRLAGDLVRIPYCLPDDEALVERLKVLDCAEMSEIWLAMLERIYTAGELFTLGLHPERVNLCKDALRAVLAKAQSLSPPIWIARLDEIAAWYRSLGKATFETESLINGDKRVSVHAPAGATLLVRSVDIEAPESAWGDGYQRILSNELIIRGEWVPWIGLPPDCPASLQSFLQHQGYLVEISANPRAFSYYFQRKTFQPEDERPLLAELETGTQPLLRLGRWPEGARAALAVTGDVDAFTLWDYGLRLWNR